MSTGAMCWITGPSEMMFVLDLLPLHYCNYALRPPSTLKTMRRT